MHSVWRKPVHILWFDQLDNIIILRKYFIFNTNRGEKRERLCMLYFIRKGKYTIKTDAFWVGAEIREEQLKQNKYSFTWIRMILSDVHYHAQVSFTRFHREKLAYWDSYLLTTREEKFVVCQNQFFREEIFRLK